MDCKLWTGSTRGKGYGQVWDPTRKRQIGAHVKAWEDANGQQVPTGMMVMHACDTKLCVEPSHLRIGTVTDNNRDMFTKGRGSKPPINPRDPTTGRWTRAVSV